MVEASHPPFGLPVQANSFAGALARELGDYLSEMNANAVVSACATAAGVRREQLGPLHLRVIVAQVQASLGVFGVSEERKKKCLARLLVLSSLVADGPRGEEELTIPVEHDADIVRARNAGKTLCIKLGFTELDVTKVVTAISELARNIVKYARKGTITLRRTYGGSPGIEVVASDRGPGIADVEAALRSARGPRRGLGVGLRGTRALVDFFGIHSRPGEGTIVTVHKLRR